MSIIQLIIQIILSCLLFAVAAMGHVFFFRFRWPSATMWGLKVFASSLSTVFLAIGIVSTILGLLSGSVFIALGGAWVTCIYLFHFVAVTRPPESESGFENAFGPDWSESLKPDQKERFLISRRLLKLPALSKPLVEKDITFAVIPATGQELLCDIWLPTPTVKYSGTALIYMHGGAFYALDKNFATGPFFSHLTAQGHVIMDIAYRLAPEAGLVDMITDVQRALAWMKENAGKYHVDPNRIILGGGSSGGYLALMAAYTSNTIFTPPELDSTDYSCLAVLAESPSIDLEALYYNTEQRHTSSRGAETSGKKYYKKLPLFLKKKFGNDLHRLRMDRNIENIGRISHLMGGSPEECPEVYKSLSPASYVQTGCPPTLLVHGSHDMMAPVQSTRLLFDQLTKAEVPTVMHIIEQSDHAFNRFLPRISPAAISVVYDVERFISVVSDRNLKMNICHQH